MTNSSNEFDDSDEIERMFNDSMIEQFISDARDQQFPRDRCWDSDRRDNNHRSNQGHAQLGPSCEHRDRQLTPEEKVNLQIREAEASKARVHDVPGNETSFLQFQCPISPNYEIDFSKEHVHSVMVDESYQLVASHLDETIQGKMV